MSTRAGFVLAGLLVVSAAHAAEPAGCTVRKGLYDSWLSLAKRSTHALPKVGSLLGASRPTGEPVSSQEIDTEYQTFFQCLNDAPLPAGDDGVRSLCKDAAADRLGSLVCQLALYIKTNRTAGTDLLDALPAGKKGAELLWDLDSIAASGAPEKRFPALFAPKGPAYKLIDELFVLALDDRDTAMSKYFHIAGAAAGPAVPYTDAQIKVLLRESPALVVKQWQVLRQYQPRLKKLLAELSAELGSPELNKLRQGISGVCTKDNLDCPEILKFFGRPQ